MSAAQGFTWRVFRWPIALGVATTIGLLSALLDDGIWDGVSWLMLSVPVGMALLKSRPIPPDASPPTSQSC